MSVQVLLAQQYLTAKEKLSTMKPGTRESLKISLPRQATLRKGLYTLVNFTEGSKGYLSKNLSSLSEGVKAKGVVINYVLDNVPNVTIQYTKFGNPKPECFDKADSWVIAKAGYTLCQREKNSESLKKS